MTSVAANERRTNKCTRVAKSGVLAMDNLSSRPGDFGRYATIPQGITFGSRITVST